jgi:hypothetical protein
MVGFEKFEIAAKNRKIKKTFCVPFAAKLFYTRFFKKIKICRIRNEDIQNRARVSAARTTL